MTFFLVGTLVRLQDVFVDEVWPETEPIGYEYVVFVVDGDVWHFGGSV